MGLLDGLVDMNLSDNEYKEWTLFKNITRNTNKFGITIGGFAKYNKSTLIAVTQIVTGDKIWNLTCFILYRSLRLS